jgi:glutathione S-transferase
MGRSTDVARSLLASAFTLGTGMSASHAVAKQPEQRIEVYEFESCPFCRKVREALSALDLDARILPCPPRGERFRAEVVRRGGKALFPFLVDPNTGREMYESNDINRYLASTYGDGRLPVLLSLGPLTTLNAGLGNMMRLGKVKRAPSKAPERDLELWSYEASPYCRIAREVLCNLEIPYVLHNVARHSKKRKELVERSGKMMVPYLADPNTGREMFESADIVDYLISTYSA